MDVRDGALGRGRGHMAEAGEEGKGSRSAVLSCYAGAGPSEKPLKGVTAAEGSSLPHLIPENEHWKMSTVSWYCRRFTGLAGRTFCFLVYVLPCVVLTLTSGTSLTLLF